MTKLTKKDIEMIWSGDDDKSRREVLLKHLEISEM
jgi:hypothetical protein